MALYDLTNKKIGNKLGISFSICIISILVMCCLVTVNFFVFKHKLGQPPPVKDRELVKALVDKEA